VRAPSNGQRFTHHTALISATVEVSLTNWFDVQIVTFLDLPREVDGATDVREGALSLVQALSFILCGRMAKEWTPQDIEAALIAYEDAVAQKMRKFQLLPDSGESFEKDLDLFSN
jgi:hypothetical protein